MRVERHFNTVVLGYSIDFKGPDVTSARVNRNLCNNAAEITPDTNINLNIKSITVIPADKKPVKESTQSASFPQEGYVL